MEVKQIAFMLLFLDVILGLLYSIRKTTLFMTVVFDNLTNETIGLCFILTRNVIMTKVIILENY